ncbi:MAG: hypothetical protein JW783_00095 [Bacteroidales bacterium]|nr:hypothetical protein [Bacteroidales bacterium]MBN2748730.1 hypothetical protein [Bacteroidales bacterium]
MRTMLKIAIGLALLISIAGAYASPFSDGTADKTQIAEGAITITSSPELQALADMWIAQYNKAYPVGMVSLSANASSAAIMLSSDNNTTWTMVVGHNAIIPIVNAKNPLLKQINGIGVNANTLHALLSATNKPSWNALLNETANANANIYFANASEVKNSVLGYAKVDANNNNWQEVATRDLIAAVKADIYAIGFCRLTDVRDANTNTIIQGIQILPVDKNGNGNIDAFENIYQDLKTFTRGVWIGKYPSALSGSVYATAAEMPTNETTLAFLRWVLTEGQYYLNQNGYCELGSRERLAKLNSISPSTGELNPMETQTASNRWVLYLLTAIGIAAVAGWIVASSKQRRAATPKAAPHTFAVIDENAIAAPKGLYFDKTHTWAFMEPDGNVRVGIDDFLQHVTGTLTRVILRKKGEEVRRGEKIVTLIRNGKQLDIYAPISGTIKAQNPAILSSTAHINTSPYSNGWVYMIEPKNWLREIQFLFLGDRYKEWIKDEFTRLKDFFASAVNTMPNAQVVYQDGGEIIDHVLADLEPQIWEEFQSKFIDPSR